MRNRRPKPGEKILFTKIPPGLLNDLPSEDQRSIREVVGKPVRLVEYDSDGAQSSSSPILRV